MNRAMIVLWLTALSAADAAGGHRQTPSTWDPVAVAPQPNGAPLTPEPNPNELNVYLPQQILWDNNPITLLQSQGQDGYMVALGGRDFDALGAGHISFRNSKNWADKSEHVVLSGETLQGQDEGDGWVSFRINVRRPADKPAEEQPEKPEDPTAEEQPAKLPAADGPDGWRVLSCSSSTWDRTSGRWVCLPEPTTTTTTTTTITTTTTTTTVNSKALTWDPISGKWIKRGGPDSLNAAGDERVARGEWVADGITYQYAREDRYVREKLSDIANPKVAKRVDQKQKIDSDSYYVSFEKMGKKTV